MAWNIDSEHNIYKNWTGGFCRFSLQPIISEHIKVWFLGRITYSIIGYSATTQKRIQFKLIDTLTTGKTRKGDFDWCYLQKENISRVVNSKGETAGKQKVSGATADEIKWKTKYSDVIDKLKCIKYGDSLSGSVLSRFVFSFQLCLIFPGSVIKRHDQFTLLLSLTYLRALNF